MRLTSLYVCTTCNCPVAAFMTDWSSWSACSATCGTYGHQVAHRRCFGADSCKVGERSLKDLTQQRPCFLGACPVANRWVGWSEWSACSASCNGGIRSRHASRCVTTQSCQGSNRQYAECSPQQCTVDGQWTDWSSWSNCTADCGEGRAVRSRQCADPSPAHWGRPCEGPHYESTHCLQKNGCEGVDGQWTDWSSWSNCTADCGEGRAVRSRQCADPTPAHWGQPFAGGWSGWMEWSKCSASCDSGHHYRERTCTEPSPVGGAPCPGFGSEVATCFIAPCPDMVRQSTYLAGDSVITYLPADKPTRILQLFIKFKPLGNTGVLVHRWHSVLLTIAGQAAIVRLNDLQGFVMNFTGIIPDDVDYDQPMMIGSKGEPEVTKSDHPGFKGFISALHVNFEAYTLQHTEHWQGHGSPEYGIDIQTDNSDPEAFLPRFTGRSYAVLAVPESVRQLRLKLTLKLDTSGSQLLLFSRGREPGSFVSLTVHAEKLRLCINTGVKESCVSSDTIAVDTWYVVDVVVTGDTAELVTQSAARTEGYDITAAGPHFSPDSQLLVGGGNAADWSLVVMATEVAAGLTGVVRTVGVNGVRHEFTDETLYSRDGVMLSTRASLADRYDEVYTHKSTMVTLTCSHSLHGKLTNDTGEPVAGSDSSTGQTSGSVTEGLRLVWFKDDQELALSDNIKLEEKTVEGRLVSRLSLLPTMDTHSEEGPYVCEARRDGYTRVIHAYGVAFHTNLIGLKEELELAEIVVAVVAIALFCLTAIATTVSVVFGIQRAHESSVVTI
ncbi:PREDICTED: uncharacterized protein LOC106814045 [Priapulus caudatus]|uniref:Uncharacterized protein LOC106814045 n=1 Tax=Priapulus caudatus TaxID=37621 RepID=A0ABM1ENM2_PRICU|nr:PREDICTED: uncharacterized protein LOC106814045 [Priapulus caudatus]